MALVVHLVLPDAQTRGVVEVAIVEGLDAKDEVRVIRDEQTNGPDAVLMLPIRYGMGYAFPNELMPMSPSGPRFLMPSAPSAAS